uniref:UCH domain-containing protein n=1 Tax=Brugia timori TaxID=42155 RepID=A0A0R3RBW6_9BILA
LYNQYVVVLMHKPLQDTSAIMINSYLDQVIHHIMVKLLLYFLMTATKMLDFHFVDYCKVDYWDPQNYCMHLNELVPQAKHEKLLLDIALRENDVRNNQKVQKPMDPIENIHYLYHYSPVIIYN